MHKPYLSILLVFMLTTGDAQPVLQWGKTFDAANLYNYNAYSNGRSVAVDLQGNVYSAGLFMYNVDFDPGPGVYTVAAQGPFDYGIYISKLSPTGDFIWAKQIPVIIEFSAIEIAVDNNGNVYLTSNFNQAADMDPGPGVQMVTPIGGKDAFVIKLGPNGDLVWVKQFGGPGDTVPAGSAITIDPNGNVIVCGVFNNTVDFDPGPGVSAISNLYDEPVLTKFDPDGNFIYKAAFRSISYGTGMGSRLVTDAAQNIYITGYISGTLDFEPGPGVYPLSSSSDYSPFVVKLSRCTNVTATTINSSACSSYTLNDQTYTASGIYTQTIPNSTGCDSIITLNLTINGKRAEQTKAICDGESFYAGSAYQVTSGIYIDTLLTSLGCDSIVTTYLTVNPKASPTLGPDKDLCRNTALVITPGTFYTYLWQDGSTLQNFTINAPGTYWVKVTNNYGCPATDSVRINSFIDGPANFLKPIDSICPYDKLVLAAQPNFGAYSWSTGSTNNMITVEAPGEYWLNVVGTNGCTGKDTVIVLPKQYCQTAVFIPTSFTPNGDGKNDSFKAMVYGNLQSFKLQVFDRWGQLIFQTTDPARGWEGFYKGVVYTTTTFVWQCFYQFKNGQLEYQKGTITLIR